MPLGEWLTIHFKKILTLLLWEMEKLSKNINCFFFPHKKLSLNRLLIIALKASVSISHKYITYYMITSKEMDS